MRENGEADPERARLLSERGQSVVSREAGAEQHGAAAPWHRWGTYLAERQWGTVREDYSGDGRAWDFFPYEHSSARVYRWGEDGLLGLCDDQMRLCFALALWNEADPHTKQRLFGLTGPQGNHGEDVKECYYYLDGTPTHSYMRALYRYPQGAFPYDALRAENARRSRQDPEWELLDTGIFDDGRYFDVVVEYAKASPTDVCIRITATNHGRDAAPLHLLPTLWFRNTWSWGLDERRPALTVVPGEAALEANHPTLGTYWFAWEGQPRLLFTENETNTQRLWQVPNRTRYTRDAIDAAVVDGRLDAVNPGLFGTRMAADYRAVVPAGATETLLLRLSAEHHARPFADVAHVFAVRQAEADQYYALMPGAEDLSDDERQVRRQAYAGLLWSKQVYIWDLPQWISGDPAGPPPPSEREHGRNSGWAHFNTTHVLSMPDAWEYPWFAAWDLAFHCVPMAHLDPEFAKDQLTILLREWYMHPNGQIPAYEWSFDDVNPPVHAWAAWRVYQIDREKTGTADRGFLERVFHKLLLNFTWWVNRKDPQGRNVFEGGFLGLDNIGVFDRSAPLPVDGTLVQSDGTSWMAMYSLNMLRIAIELAQEDDVYQDIATKFFEHFLMIGG
ncbi:MAG TPA: glucosidase, partial [Chloroflexota bacterium]